MTAIRPSCQITAINAPSFVPLAEHQKLERDYEELLETYDVVLRACRNPKFSDVYFRLLVAFLEAYPHALRDFDQPFEVDVALVRTGAGAGDKKKNNATRFFQDMEAAGVWDYESKYDKTLGKRRSLLTPHQALAYSEDFDTNTAARKRRKREEEEKQKNQFKDPRKLWNCPECGGEMLYDVVPHCSVCHHAQPTIKDIPASEITIEAEILEVSDEWTQFANAETEQRPAVRGVQVTQATLSALAPASAPAPAAAKAAAKAPGPELPPMPDKACVHCGKPRRVCFEKGPEGLWWSSCQ